MGSTFYSTLKQSIIERGCFLLFSLNHYLLLSILKFDLFRVIFIKVSYSACMTILL